MYLYIYIYIYICIPYIYHKIVSFTNKMLNIMYIWFNWIMVKIQLSFRYSELHVNYFAVFNLVWRNDGHEDAHVWDFLKQAKASGFKMIFYKEDLSNLVNVFAQKILFPLNSFSVFFLFFAMRSKIITVVRLIPTLMSTFIFLVTSDKDLSARNLNDNLSRTNHCGF